MKIGDQRGIGLVEVILALGVFAVLAPVLAGLGLGGFRSLEQGGDETEAALLAQEGWEAVRAIKDRAWNENVYTQSGVDDGVGVWQFMGEGTQESLGKFSRVITYEDVCRDGSFEIVVCPGTFTDVEIKLVRVEVAWTSALGKSRLVVKEGYVSNWDSQEWVEDDQGAFGDGVMNQTEVVMGEGDGDGGVRLGRQ